METYKNTFHPHEDAMLWELHEIRHELHQILRHKTVEDITADALKKYQQWQEEVGKMVITREQNDRHKSIKTFA